MYKVSLHRYYHRTKDGKLQNSPYVDNSYKWAGGGFVSTAPDLVKFGNALLASYNHWQYQTKASNEAICDEVMGKRFKYLLKPSTVAMMWKPVVKISDANSFSDVHYGMGWFVEESSEGVVGGRRKMMTVSHTGGAVGASCVLTIIPAEEGG